MKLFDFNDPFYKPLWLRVGVVGFAGIWAVVEFVIGSPFFGVLFGALAAVAFYGLFVTFNPREPEDNTKKDGNNG